MSTETPIAQKVDRMIAADEARPGVGRSAEAVV